MTTCDVAVVGAGPGGMTAAATAARHGCSVCLIDDNPSCGGQIWRNYEQPKGKSAPPQHFIHLRQALQNDRIDLRPSASVIAQPAPNVLRIETTVGFSDVHYQKLILATGARERFLPFPGWTLPGIVGVGALQALVKAGLPIRGKRVVLAGSGPLLLAVAAALSREGARVLGIFEQAPFTKLAKFSIHLLRHPARIREGLAYRSATLGSQFRPGSWVVRAVGPGSLHSVEISVNGSVRNFDCDYLACAFHLIPNLELPRLLGCEIQNGFVRVNESQQTSSRNVYCVGEPTGIGGLDKALCEGEIAGLVCAGLPARHLYLRRDRCARFALQLEQAFSLRPELAKLADPETLLCRCEDVPRGALDEMHSWREAKLHTRCGMGPCQGRICGPAAELLFGWDSSQVRPPIFPARVATLAGTLQDNNP